MTRHIEEAGVNNQQKSDAYTFVLPADVGEHGSFAVGPPRQ